VRRKTRGSQEGRRQRHSPARHHTATAVLGREGKTSKLIENDYTTAAFANSCRMRVMVAR
jgi:hypothetical protein